MQKIDEPESFETDKAKYKKWLFFIIIFIIIMIFKAAAKKEIRDNSYQEIENNYDESNN